MHKKRVTETYSRLEVHLTNNCNKSDSQSKILEINDNNQIYNISIQQEIDINTFTAAVL
ncbi:3060_t:CDS:1, partial [Cetraspora pellucida]